MPSITLTNPVPGTDADAGPIATNFTNLQTLLNGGLDNTNIDASAVLDAVARVGVRKNSAGSTFNRRRINLIEGTGVTLTVADDSANEEVDVTIASSSTTTYRKSTTKAVTDTVADTDLLNGEITVGAGVMSTDRVVRLEAWGDWVQNSGASRTLPRFKIKLGGTPTTVIDTGAIGNLHAGASASRFGWKITCHIQNLGATNSQWTNFSLEITHADSGAAVGSGSRTVFTTGAGQYSVIGLAGTVVGGLAFAEGGAASAIDTTAAMALILSVINPTATSTCETKLYGALVTVL